MADGAISIPVTLALKNLSAKKFVPSPSADPTSQIE